MNSPLLGIVLPCAGSGTRVGADRPKQFLDLGGKPVFHWSLATFLAHPKVNAVVLVVAPSEREDMAASLAEAFGADLASGRLLVADGGKERWESVRNGVAELPGTCRLVAIHDVARPFVTESDIDRVVEAALDAGGATLAVPAADTIKWADDSPTSFDAPLVARTIDRRRVWLTQTPQAFRREILEACYAALPLRPDLAPTDEAGLAEAFGHPVRLVQGGTRLNKITTADDLDWARWTASRADAGT